MHLELNPKGDYRLVAISDCHGGLPVLKKLLQRVELKADDYLIILGDFIQKGPHNLNMMKFIRDLSERPNTYILTGNHEYYIRMLMEKEHAKQLIKHMGGLFHECIIEDWLESLGQSFDGERAIEIQDTLKEEFSEDLKFLEGLPWTLKMDQFLFVHGGADDEHYKKSDATTLLKRDRFYLETHTLNETVVCGHWPVGNYRKTSLSCVPILDEEKRIFSIDGGQGVKSYGQINALIIDRIEGSYTYQTIFEDEFPKVIVKRDYPGIKEELVKLSFDSNEVKVLDEEGLYYNCIKSSTGERTRVPKMLVAKDEDQSYVKRNWVNYYPKLVAGDLVHLIDVIDWLAMIKIGEEVGFVPVEYLDI